MIKQIDQIRTKQQQIEQEKIETKGESISNIEEEQAQMINQIDQIRTTLQQMEKETIESNRASIANLAKEHLTTKKWRKYSENEYTNKTKLGVHEKETRSI